MATTSFANVPVYSRQYNRIMKMVGDCIEKGGAVWYEHHHHPKGRRSATSSDKWVFYDKTVMDTVDVVLSWK
jgi:F0F1-type ATP synthase beta subunit